MLRARLERLADPQPLGVMYWALVRPASSSRLLSVLPATVRSSRRCNDEERSCADKTTSGGYWLPVKWSALILV